MKSKNLFFNNVRKSISFYSWLLVMCFLLFPSMITAQMVFEDAKGQDVLVQYLGGLISLNTSNDSIKAGFTIKSSDSWCFGFDVSGKTTNGTLTLLKGGTVNPGIKINMNIGYVLQKTDWESINYVQMRKTDYEKKKRLKRIKYNYKLKKTSLEKYLQKVQDEQDKERLKKALVELEKDKNLKRAKVMKEMEKMTHDEVARKLPKQRNWINLRLGYERAKFKMFSPDADFENQLTDELFDGFSAQLSFNSYLRYYNVLVSFAVGICHTNNAADLKKVEITDETNYGNSEQVVRFGKETVTARQGKFEEFNKGHLLLSGFWKPSKLPFGLISYGRYNYSRVLRSINLGVGAYIVKSTNALIPLGGVLVEYEDKFKGEIEDISLGDRFTISLVVNFPILIKK